MTQLELPLCSTFVVRIQATVDVTVLANDAKEATKIVKAQYFPKIARPKIMAIYRADAMPTKEENETDPTDPPRPRGRPSPSGTPKPARSQAVVKPVDAVAKSA